jgi:hypothetical protein
MGAAEVFIVVLNPVTYDPTPTAETRWGKRLNGALKTIKGIGVPRLDNVERLVVSVMANSAGSHRPWSSLVDRHNLFRLRVESIET